MMAGAQKEKPPEHDPRRGESFVGGLIKDSIPLVGTYRAYKDTKFYFKNGDYVAGGLMTAATSWSLITDVGLTASLVVTATGIGAPVGAGGATVSQTAKVAGVTGLKALAMRFGRLGLQYGTKMFAKVLAEEGLETAIKKVSKEAVKQALNDAPLVGKAMEKATEAITKEVEKKMVSEAENVYTSTFKKVFESEVVGGKSPEAAKILAGKAAKETVEKELEAGLKDSAAEHAKEIAAKKIKQKATKFAEAKTTDLKGAGKVRSAYVKAIYAPADLIYTAIGKIMDGGAFIVEHGSPIVGKVKNMVKWTTSATVGSTRVSKTVVPVVSGATVRNAAHFISSTAAKGERYVKKKAAELMEKTPETKKAEAPKTVENKVEAIPVAAEGQKYDEKIDMILNNVMNQFDINDPATKKVIDDINSIRAKNKQNFENAYNEVIKYLEKEVPKNKNDIMRGVD